MFTFPVDNVHHIITTNFLYAMYGYIRIDITSDVFVKEKIKKSHVTI